MLNFLKHKGFEFAYGLFMEFQKESEMTSFDKNFLSFLLGILRVFVTAAFMAQEPNVACVIDMVRKNSEAEDMKELEGTP